MNTHFLFQVPPRWRGLGPFFELSQSYQFDLPQVPRKMEKVMVLDFLLPADFDLLFSNLQRIWSGNTALVNEVILRRKEQVFFYELHLVCIDEVHQLNDFMTLKDPIRAGSMFG